MELPAKFSDISDSQGPNGTAGDVDLADMTEGESLVRDILGGDSPDRLEFYRQYISGELGVKVPALEDATVRAIPGRLSALSVFL